jgi:hypothetical protein
MEEIDTDGNGLIDFDELKSFIMTDHATAKESMERRRGVEDEMSCAVSHTDWSRPKTFNVKTKLTMSKSAPQRLRNIATTPDNRRPKDLALPSLHNRQAKMADMMLNSTFSDKWVVCCGMAFAPRSVGSRSCCPKCSTSSVSVETTLEAWVPIRAPYARSRGALARSSSPWNGTLS